MKSFHRTATIFRLCVFIVAGACSHVAARTDTTLYGNGGPGPYRLGTGFFDTASLVITIDDSLYATVAYTFIDEVNGILFAASIDSGIPIRISYIPQFYGVSRFYSLYQKRYLDTLSISAIPKAIVPKDSSSLGSDLSIAGYKSVGISVGSLGSTTIEQAMDVTIFGEVGPQTQFRAHLSDQGSSLEGTTREIGEIDMIYLTLTHPRYSASVGDQYISWPSGGLLWGDKKIKGLSVGFSPRWLSTKAFVAISGGKFAVQTIAGRTGFQGPYVLKGNGEAQTIMPVSGTVTVRLNGSKLIEGEGHDFTIDYDVGSVTFTPRQIIRDDDIIRIDYEYRTFDYQRILTGADVGFANRDSTLTIRGALWNESDSRNRPIDLELTAEDKAGLAAAGDGIYQKVFGRPVHPNDAPAQALLYPLYTDSMDAMGTRIFSYVDPVVNPEHRRYYRVDFIEVGAGNGEYISAGLVSPQLGTRYEIMHYVGPKRGTHTAQSPLPAPSRSTVGEITVRAQPAQWLSARVTVAGQDEDRNTFSAEDDGNNRAAASATSLTVGSRDLERRSLWLIGTHRYRSSRFSADVLPSDDRRRSWDQGVVPSRKDEQLWETAAGVTPLEKISTEFGYAQRFEGDTLVTDRLSNVSNALLWGWLGLQFRGSFFRHQIAPFKSTTRRDSLRIFAKRGAGEYWMYGADEWRDPEVGPSRGHLGIGLGFENSAWGLSQSLSATSDRSSLHQEVLFASDTGFTVTWKQSLSKRILPAWHLAGSSAHHRFTAKSPRASRTVTLIQGSSDLSTQRGFSMRQDYSVNSEQASALVQTPKYVGPGLGTHTVSLDTTRGDKYIPRAGGEWIIEERELYSAGGDELVRRSRLTTDWSYTPQTTSTQGILNDLQWRGTGGIEEHLARGSDLSSWSWLPGYYTLSGDFGDSLIRFADMYYRQNLEWRPSFNPAWHSILFVEPFLRALRSYRENGVKWGGGIDRTGAKLLVGAVVEFLRLTHEPVGFGELTGSEEYRVEDGFLELTQKYRLIGDFEAYVKETAGRGGNTLKQGSWYYALKPGISWRARDKGWAEASYTFARVEAQQRSDYRTARGYAPGISHLVEVMTDVKMGKNFSINGSYRGEISTEHTRGMHTVSLQVKAYL